MVSHCLVMEQGGGVEIGDIFLYTIYFIFGLAQMGCPLHGFEVPTLLEGLLYW